MEIIVPNFFFFGYLQILPIFFQELSQRVDILMDHADSRRKDQKSWVLNHLLIVSFIQKVLGLDEETMGATFKDANIHRAIGLLKTNSVKLDSGPGFNAGLALFPIFSLLNHNCLCNTRTRKFYRNDEHVIYLEAILPIKKGEEIYTRYRQI